MKKQTCCFTGHRAIAVLDEDRIKQQLEKQLIALINQGYIYFCTGGALGFDTLAAQTVLSLKMQYPTINLTLILPHKEQAKSWNTHDRECYENIQKQATHCTYISEHYTRGCMHRRNRQLIDASSVCIAYLTQTTGGTAYTVAYASKQNVPVIFID